jgi:hypothetical protein
MDDIFSLIWAELWTRRRMFLKNTLFALCTTCEGGEDEKWKRKKV